MNESKSTAGSRHPQVILINDSSEDTLGVASIISEQVIEFRAIEHSKSTGKILLEYTPPVIIFALNTIMDSVELYSQLVEENVIAHNHDAILLCKNKESGSAFRACIKGLFDNYFVYQPLYEKFRLKLIVHNALLKHTVNKYEGITDEQFGSIDEELAELIDKGVECKGTMSDSISDCKAQIEKTVGESTSATSLDDSSQKALQKLAKDHLAPMLESLEKELMVNLDSIVDKMMTQKTVAQEARHQKQQQSKNREQQLRQTVARKQAKETRQHQTSDVDSDGASSHQNNAQQSNTSDHKTVDKNKEKEAITEAQDNQNVKSVLVVEDNDLYREMLVKVLTDAGYKVYEAGDGLAALKKIKAQRFDCILMDLFMPKLDGLNTTKHIVKTGGNNPIPVLALTGNKRKDLFKKWASLGIKGYIIKPSSKTEILEQVGKCMSLE